MNWTHKVYEAIASHEADSVNASETVIRPFQGKAEGHNQFLVLVKPEATLRSQGVDSLGILEHLDAELESWQCSVGGVTLLSGSFLRDHDVMSQHYGVINRVSRLGVHGLSNEAHNALQIAFPGLAQGSALGGHQALTLYPDLTPADLSSMVTGRNKKLAPGVYASQVRIHGHDTLVLNGFHPSQLLHFTAPESNTIAVEAWSEASWSQLRTNFIGATDPHSARVGSLREWVLQNQQALHIPAVGVDTNFFHLSAGPVEAMAELHRFFQTPQSGPAQLQTTSLGKLLVNEGVSANTLNDLAQNPLVFTEEGGWQPIFDVTEEHDTKEAAAKVANWARSGQVQPQSDQV